MFSVFHRLFLDRVDFVVRTPFRVHRGLETAEAPGDRLEYLEFYQRSNSPPQIAQLHFPARNSISHTAKSVKGAPVEGVLHDRAGRSQTATASTSPRAS